MKKKLFLVGAFLLSLGVAQSPAQFGPGGGGMGSLGMRGMPKFDGKFAKVFGDNTAFSADVEIQTAGGKADGIKAPGKLAFLEGKSRMEIDMTAAAGGKISADMSAQMKAMGMDRMIIIHLPEKKVMYQLYPGLESYTEMEIKDGEDPKAADKYKLDTTELGKETVDGHPCVKNKVVVTDDKGGTYESTTWNATDLKKFPVKMVSNQGGTEVTMLFKNVKLAKPDVSQFEPPKNFKRYGNMMEMMQEVMQRGGGFAPPGAK